MNAIRQRLRRLRRGFTLVEVSLALLVLSVGVLTAYALFPEGLNAGRAATSDTQSAMFADIIFRSYRAASTYVPWNQITTTRVRVPGEGTIWNGSGRTIEIIPSTSSIQTYRNQLSVGGTLIDENALRYKLEFREITAGRLMVVSLYIWPGLFGPTDPASAQYYYTELYNTR